MELYTFSNQFQLMSLISIAIGILLIIVLYWLIKYLKNAITIQDLKTQKLKEELRNNQGGQSGQSSSSSI